MRLVFTSDYFLPHTGGGVERVVWEVATRLARRGHDVHVVALGHGPVEADGVRIHWLPKVSLERLTRLSITLPLGRVRPLLEGCDALHAHNLFFATSASAVLSRRAPTLLTLHVGSFDQGGPFLRLAARTYERTVGRRMLRVADKVTAVSEAVARHARALGADPAKLQVVPNAVDTERFHPNGVTRGRRLVYVGRLTRNKGPHLLLQALPHILAEHPDATLDFVGDGPLAPELARRAHRLGVASRVRFVGQVPDVVPHLQAAAAYVRPSLTDGMSLTLLEAMACGTPVVATAVGGTDEVVRHGRDGLIVERTPAALARASCALLDDAAAARAIGQAARLRAETRPAWDAIARAYEACLEEVAR